MEGQDNERWIDHFLDMVRKRQNRKFYTVKQRIMERPTCGEVTPQQQTYEQAVENIKVEQKDTPKPIKIKVKGQNKKPVSKRITPKPVKTKSDKIPKVQKTKVNKKVINKVTSGLVKQTVFD